MATHMSAGRSSFDREEPPRKASKRTIESVNAQDTYGNEDISDAQGSSEALQEKVTSLEHDLRENKELVNHLRQRSHGSNLKMKTFESKMDREMAEMKERLRLKDIESEQQRQELENVRGAAAATAAAAMATAATSSRKFDNLMDVFGAFGGQQMALQVQGTRLQTRMDGFENKTEIMRRENAATAACAATAFFTADATSRKYEDIRQICGGMENNQTVLHRQNSRISTRLDGVATDVDRLEDLHPGDQHHVYDGENSNDQAGGEEYQYRDASAAF